MRPLRRRTRLEKLVKKARDAKLPGSVGAAVADIKPPSALKSAATGVLAVTAASAGVSALRRRLEEAQ